MSTGTRTQVSLAEVEKKFDDKHEELSARLEQMNVGMEEIRSMLLAQITQTQNGDFSTNNQHNQETQDRNGNTQSRNSYSTRISKVEFPRFSGKDVKEWLYKCDQFFLLDGTPAESKVRLASIHLDGIALQWHLNYMRSKFDIYPAWQQYVANVLMRFGVAYEDPLSSLIQVKQSGKVQDYVDEFELALTQVSLLPEHALSIFLAGLEHSTQMQYVMVALEGSVPISFGGTEEPAAYGELVAIGVFNPDVCKKMTAALAFLLETKLSVPKSRFFLKFYDIEA